VQLHAERLDGFVDTVRSSLSYQRMEQTRDRIRAGGNRELQGFDVDTVGFFTQLESQTPLGHLTYGIDFYHDNVNSFDTTKAFQGEFADDTTYDLLGAFVQDRITFAGVLDAYLGVRATYAAADLEEVEVDPDGAGPNAPVGSSFSDEWTDLSGSARAVWHLTRRWNLFGGVSQAFRAPNVADLSRDSDFGGGFETSSLELDPERAVEVEIGSKWRTDRLTMEIAFFHYLLNDKIVRVDLGGGGVFNKINSDDAWMQGIEYGAAYALTGELTLFGNVSWLDGEQDLFDTNGRPVSDYPDRLQPVTGQVGLRFEAANLPLWAESLVRVAGDADKLSLRDAGDDTRIPDGRTPGYVVWHLRGGWDVTDRLTLTAAVENLTDQTYRVHGSGQNRPGRNFILSVDVTF